DGEGDTEAEADETAAAGAQDGEDDGREDEDEEAHEVADEDIRVVADAHDPAGARDQRGEELDDGVRVGAARALSEQLAGERAVFAEIVAEVAAAEPPAPAAEDLDDVEYEADADPLPLVTLAAPPVTAPAAVAEAPEPPAADGPIIVELSSRGRQQREI